MRKTKFLLGAIAALSIVASAAPAASADTLVGGSNVWNDAGASPPARTGQSFGVGQHTFSIAGGNLVARCNQASTNGYIVGYTFGVASVNHNASVNMNYTSCTVTIAGIVRPATVVDACPWTLTLTHGSYVPGTGASTGTISTCGNTVITVGSIGCTVTVPPTGPKAITGQNLLNGVAGPLPSNHMQINAAVTGVNWTQTGCPVPASGSDGTYNGVTRTGTSNTPGTTGAWVIP